MKHLETKACAIQSISIHNYFSKEFHGVAGQKSTSENNMKSPIDLTADGKHSQDSLNISNTCHNKTQRSQFSFQPTSCFCSLQNITPTCNDKHIHIGPSNKPTILIKFPPY